jgi:hypothetical protein
MRRYAPVAVLLVNIGACGGPQEVGEDGTQCFRDDDCTYGLVCAVPAGGEGKVCTTDVSGLVSETDAPVPASTAGMAGTGGMAGTAGMAGTGGSAGGTSGSAGSVSAGSGGTAMGGTAGGAGTPSVDAGAGGG